MATLKSKISIDSSDFFSTKLNVSTSNSTITTGDDRAFSVERVPLGVNSYSTITQTATALSGMNNKTMIFVDNQQNTHTITFSTSYSKKAGGNKAITDLTIASAVDAAWNGKTLILIDNNATAARTVTITFNHTTTTLVRQAGATSTAIAYAAGVTTGGTTAAMRTAVLAHLVAIKTAGDLDITATANVSNSLVIDLVQDYEGSTGNTLPTGTLDDSTAGVAALTAFTTGGLGYTSSYAGISDNAATTTAHLTSLRNSLIKAINEGKLNMSVGIVPTASTFILNMTGPYTADTSISIAGTAITTGSTTAATAFSGAGVPEVLPCGEFNSTYNKVYIYACNKSTSGTVNLYHKESVAVAAGTLTLGKADTADLNVGGILTIVSPKGYAYTFTIVAAGHVTANTRISDLAYAIEDTTASDVLMTSIIETINLVDNKAGREQKPFSATVDSTGLILTIKQTDTDAGTTGNTAISDDYEGGSLTAVSASFTGGLDRYHLICRLEPGEHVYAPFSGFPKLYTDSNTAICDLEYLTLEK